MGEGADQLFVGQVGGYAEEFDAAQERVPRTKDFTTFRTQ